MFTLKFTKVDADIVSLGRASRYVFITNIMTILPFGAFQKVYLNTVYCHDRADCLKPPMAAVWRMFKNQCKKNKCKWETNCSSDETMSC